jgi:uncharacterized protein YecE (DUF72 family)
MSPGIVRIGTSGWAYPHWRDRFYPPGLPSQRQLAYLADRFATVEVNRSFYSLLRPETVARWRGQTPPGFVFAVKGSRFITHMTKLGRDPAPLANFFASGVLGFGGQLGPILWQLPVGLPFDRERATRFLSRLPRDLAEAERLARRHDGRLRGRARVTAPDARHARLRHALEVRHPSWLDPEVLRLLAREDIALVSSDTAGRHPFSLVRTSPTIAYVRLHGSRILYTSAYTAKELSAWADLVRGWAGAGTDVFVYFDNDAQAHAPHDARQLNLLVFGQPGRPGRGMAGVVEL